MNVRRQRLARLGEIRHRSIIGIGSTPRFCGVSRYEPRTFSNLLNG
jgi:hypothetical protein